MASIADLVINLVAETASLSAGLDRGFNDVKKFTSNVEHQLDSLKSAGEALVAALAIDKIVEFGEKALEAGDRINKLAQISGTTVEQFSALAYAARLADVDQESLAQGLGKLSRAMIEAGNGNGKLLDAFKAVGVSAKDLKTLNVDQILQKIATAFSGAADDATKTDIAIALLGRSGAQLIPFLNQGADGMRKMADEAKALGAAWTTEDAQAAEEFHDNLTRLEVAAEALARRVAMELLPYLKELSDEAIGLGKDHATITWVEDLATAIKVLAVILDTTVTGLRELYIRAAQIMALGEGVAGWLEGEQDAFRSARDLQELLEKTARDWQVRVNILFPDEYAQQVENRLRTIVGFMHGDQKAYANDDQAAAAQYFADHPNDKPKNKLKLGSTENATQLSAARNELTGFLAQIAEANDNVVGKIEATWNQHIAKIREIFKKYPQLRKEFGDLELQAEAAKNAAIEKQAQELFKKIEALNSQPKASRLAALIPTPTIAPDAGTREARLKQENDSFKADKKAQLEAADEIFQQTKTHAEQLATEESKLNVLLNAGLITQTEYNRRLHDLKNQLDDNHIAWANFGAEIGQTIEQAALFGQSWSSALKQLLVDLIKVVAELYIIKPLLDSMKDDGSDSGAGGFFSSILGGLFHRAGGGDVQAGQAYMTGENGRELFVPQTDGYIVPNSALKSAGGAGLTVVVNNDLRGTDAQTYAYIERRSQKATSDAVRIALARGADARRRVS